MSPEVQVLPQTLINKIAAGEVIVRPASVVKELVDNAFDAGATRIRVEVSRDGRSISVIDDGCGMDDANARRAILRHSTSKIRSFEDLMRVATRGFRGEALASIISVSRFEMLTRPAHSLSGTRLVAAGGKVESIEPVGTAPGTAIHVRDLFYNTPARLKFLKNPGAEFNALVQILTQQAFSRPEVGLLCVRDGEARFDLPPGQNLLERTEQLLGSGVRGELVAVDYERDGVAVRGYIGRPSISRKDRRWQFFLINGRPISARQLTHPFQQAYHGLLMTQRFPVGVLNIEIDPEEVDINVHPTKEEVRFEEEKKVAGLVHRATSEALRGQNLMPTFGGAHGASPRDEARTDSGDPTLPFVFSSKGIVPHGRKPGPLPSASRTPDLFPNREFTRPSPRAQDGGDRDHPRPMESTSPPLRQPEPQSVRPAEEPELPVEALAPRLQVGEGPPPVALGQVARTYIVAEWGESLLIIDQHAAHERLVYQQLCDRPARSSVPRQTLLAPIAFTVSEADRDALMEMLPLLEELGVEVRHEGGGQFAATALPQDLDQLDVAALVQDLLDASHQGDASGDGVEELRDRVRIRMACHSAIRAGQALHPNEMQALLNQMSEARLSFTCPHGRPTMVLLRKGQLDRQFGRLR